VGVTLVINESAAPVDSTALPSDSRSLPRLPTVHETAVIRRVLEVGALQPVADRWVSSVARWLIVARCPCGCDSLYFHAVPPPFDFGEVIAHAIGIDRTSGRHIDILLWAREGVATFMELEPLSRGTPRLPSVESIRRAPGDLYDKIWT
jgi:hypothetical protein